LIAGRLCGWGDKLEGGSVEEGWLEFGSQEFAFECEPRGWKLSQGAGNSLQRQE
jgi:hypothetical protein